MELLSSSTTESTTETRELALDSTTQEELGRWLDVRRQILRVRHVNLTTSPLFCKTSADRAGLSLTISQVRVTIARLGKRATLQRGVRSSSSSRTQAVAHRAAVRCLRSELTRDGTPLHEIVDLAVHEGLGMDQPSDGMRGLFDMSVVLQLLEAQLAEESHADASEVAQTSAILDLWHKLSAR